jgi:hypothetical protein
MNNKQKQKVLWFSLRTGCTHEEAERWLTAAHWKINNAEQDRRAHNRAEWEQTRDAPPEPEQL